MTNKSTSTWRTLIKVHPAADLFPMMNDEELDALTADIRKNRLLEKITLWSPEVYDPRAPAPDEPWQLLDGRNRLEALERAGGRFDFDGDKDIFARCAFAKRKAYKADGSDEFTVEPWIDPYEYVVSTNILRRHLTFDQKRDLIEKLIKAQPEKSNRQLAEMAKVSHPTIGTARAKLEKAGELDRPPRTMGKDGKTRPTKPRHEPAPMTQAEETRRRAWQWTQLKKLAAPVPALVPKSRGKILDDVKDILEMEICAGRLDGPPSAKAIAEHAEAFLDRAREELPDIKADDLREVVRYYERLMNEVAQFANVVRATIALL